MRRLFGCPDIVSLTEKFLMARNFFQIFTENNPTRGTGKNIHVCNMHEAKGLTVVEDYRASALDLILLVDKKWLKLNQKSL